MEMLKQLFGSDRDKGEYEELATRPERWKQSLGYMVKIFKKR